MKMPSVTQLITLSSVIVACFLFLSHHQPMLAQGADSQSPAASTNIYLPLIAGVGADSAPATQTPTPTATKPAEGGATVTKTPTSTPTATRPSVSLPAPLVGSWFTGNLPLNDFYDPTSGEWREVNGIGQRYLFASNGEFTYTGFARFQSGPFCKYEVSVYKKGIAQPHGNSLTLETTYHRTRTVFVCPSAETTYTDTLPAPVRFSWNVAANDKGHIQLTTTEPGSEGPYHKLGMAESLLGVWRTPGMVVEGFYDPSTKHFNPDSPKGRWLQINADNSYISGERATSFPNSEGCVLEGWAYETGVIEVVGGSFTLTPTSGIARTVNSCDGQVTIYDPMVSEPSSFAWSHRDLQGDVKLGLIRLMPFEEITYQR